MLLLDITYNTFYKGSYLKIKWLFMGIFQHTYLILHIIFFFTNSNCDIVYYLGVGCQVFKSYSPKVQNDVMAPDGLVL